MNLQSVTRTRSPGFVSRVARTEDLTGNEQTDARTVTGSVPLWELTPSIHHFCRPKGKQKTPGGHSSRLSSFLPFPRRTWAISAARTKTLGFERANWGPERNTPVSGRPRPVWTKNSLTLWLTDPSELPTRFLSDPCREVRTEELAD